MDVEAVLLTGGASMRMGQDKSQTLIAGRAMADLVLAALAPFPVTVLGRSPIEGHGFLKDEVDFAGPAFTLSRFRPSRPYVMVASCDLPRLRPEVPHLLLRQVSGFQAALPCLDGQLQFLCGLYSAEAFPLWRAQVDDGARSMHELVGPLRVRRLDEAELRANDIDPACLAGVNRPTDLSP